MSHKKTKTKKHKSTFFADILTVLKDISFAYRNFLHWNISKIIISLWSFLLGVILSLPVFTIIIIIWIVDPVNWSEVIAYALSGSTEVSIELISALAMHPYNIAFMLLLLATFISLFLLWNSYGLFLRAEVSLWYVKQKKLKYKKNYYFKVAFIQKCIAIFCWSFMYLLVPVIIWAGLLFFTYLFYNAWILSFDGLSIIVALITLILIICELYLLYRLLFGYIIFADHAKKKHTHTALHYVKESIKITKWRVFFKFMFLYILFVVLIAPGILLDGYFETQWAIMRDAILYNSGLLQNLEPQQVQYYEYISQEYNDMTNEEISSKLDSLAALRFILYIVMYLLVSGVFVLWTTSFYKRVLVKK